MGIVYAIKHAVSVATVHRVHSLFADGKNQQEISKEVGLHQANISLILRGKAWKHLDMHCNGRTNNRSGCVGVYFKKLIGRWKAEIIQGGKYRNLGTYESYDEEQQARKSVETGVYHRI